MPRPPRRRPRTAPAALLAAAALALPWATAPGAHAQDADAPAAAHAADAHAALPAVLDQLPAAYVSAIIVPDLGALDAGLAAFEAASVLDLAELQDVVGRFKREMGVTHGVDDGGSMAVVVLEPGDEPIVVMLLPVADADALAASLGAEPGEVVEVTLPTGETGAMRMLDGFAVLGPNRNVVQAYAPANDADAFATRFGAMGTQALADAQLCFAFDPTAMDPDKLADELTGYAAALLGHANTLLAYDLAPRELMPLMSSMSRLITRGTDGVVVAFAFSAYGMDYTEAYRLNGETAMTELFPAGGTGTADAADTLAKLPAGPAVYAVAGDPAAVGLVAFADRLGALVGLDPHHALGTARPILQELTQHADAVATAYYALDSANQATSRWMNTVTVFEVEDEERFAEALEKAVMSLNEAQLPVPGGEAITFTATYEPEDRLLGGVRYDTFTLKVNVPEDLHDEPMMLALAALGKIGFIGQAAVVDGHVVVTTFDDLATMDRALAAVDSGRGLGADADFPLLLDAGGAAGTRSAVGYIDLRALAQTLAPFYAIVGDTDPAQADPNTRPIAFAITARDGEAQARLFLPTSALDALALEDFEPNLRDNNADNGQPGNPGDPGLGPGGRPGRGPGTLDPGGPRSNPGNPGTRPGREPTRPGREPGRTPGRGR